jgi:hypothetical protein
VHRNPQVNRTYITRLTLCSIPSVLHTRQIMSRFRLRLFVDVFTGHWFVLMIG